MLWLAEQKHQVTEWVLETSHRIMTDESLSLTVRADMLRGMNQLAELILTSISLETESREERGGEECTTKPSSCCATTPRSP
jgi:hypothetical protein